MTKGDWMEIEAPANAYAFVAAMYLKQEAAAPVEANTAPPTETAPPDADAGSRSPAHRHRTPVPRTRRRPQSNLPRPHRRRWTQTVPPPPPRIVSHEGVVRHVGSLIAPTAYKLYDPATDSNIDFLYTTTTNLDLSRYVGMRIIVTGEEGLAARWTEFPF